MKTEKYTHSSELAKKHRASNGWNTDYLTIASADAGRLRRAKIQMRRKKQRKRKRIVLSGIALCLVLLAALLLSHFGRRNADEGTHPGTDTTQNSSMSELPAGWSWQKMAEKDLSQGTLVLVNRDHAYDPELPQTVSVFDKKTQSYFVKDKILSLREDTADALNQWMDAFAAESGKTDVNIVAGWRSYEDQVYLYQNAVDTKGQAHADAYLALPGCSEHHTGLAVDLDTYNIEDGTSGGFDGEGAYAWAVEHAWEYGFIQRYPPEKSDITGIDYESWHFRYVGIPHAYIMQTQNLCLEEYLDYLRKYPFSGEHLTVSCLGASYELYYCPKDQVAVPASDSYTISGNNVDGYIVTVPRP